MNKAIKLISAVLFPLMLFVFSCGKTKTVESKVVTITFWHSFVSATVPALNDLIAKFESEHPDIRIKAQYVPTGDALVQKLITAIQSKSAPDISWIHSDFLDKLVEADAIYKMDHFIKGNDSLSQSDFNDIFPQLLNAAKWRDTLYAMPMEATTLALYYNKDLFIKAGLNPNHPPENWDELKEYAKKLTVDKNGDGKTDQYGFYIPAFPASGPLSIWMVLQWVPYLWQAGGSEINKEQTEVLFNSDAGVKALTLWKDIFSELNLKNLSLSHDMGFASKTVAMIMDGPWDLPQFRQVKDLNFAVASLPMGPAKKATYLAGEHLVIFKLSSHPEKAWEFVKWVIKPEVQAFFSEKSGYLPIRKSTLSLRSYQDFLSRDSAMKAFVDQIQIGQARATIDYHRIEINQNIASAVEQSVMGALSPKTSLDLAAAASNRLLLSAQALHK